MPDALACSSQNLGLHPDDAQAVSQPRPLSRAAARVAILATFERYVRSPARDSSLITLLMNSLVGTPDEYFRDWSDAAVGAVLSAFLENAPTVALEQMLLEARDQLEWLEGWENGGKAAAEAPSESRVSSIPILDADGALIADIAVLPDVELGDEDLRDLDAFLETRSWRRGGVQ